MVNLKVVAFVLSILLIIEGACMLLVAPVSWIYGDSDASHILLSSLITAFTGFILWALFRKCNKNIGKREGFIIVSLGWIVFSLFGAIPFLISPRGIPSFTDAFFETISGVTTTGASILNDIESLSHGLLFWRSLTQWLGGMGIIVLSLVILPILGIGGMQLFVAEVPGPTPDKLHPRIKETAKRLWGIYMILTIAEVILLKFGGMSLFDAVNHAFTTLATGGYSTRQSSIVDFSPYIQYVITLFMIIAGVNFSLSYFAMHFKFKRVWTNEEFRSYISFIGIFTLIITLVLTFTVKGQAFEKSFRDALFQVVSIMTTTGFVTSDYLKWASPAIMLLLVLMFFGGSAGSTGGSIKIVRILLVLKNGLLELKRLIHPNAIVPVRIDKQAVQPEVITNVLAFVTVYIAIWVIGVVVISFQDYDLDTSMGAVAATLGNIGPGIGKVGPMSNYAHFNDFGKWFLSFLMLIGRLELFTVLVLFTQTFWKK